MLWFFDPQGIYRILVPRPGIELHWTSREVPVNIFDFNFWKI